MFTHLHVHSQYSLLDGAASIKSLVSTAKKADMKALALTDHGNMFGVKAFFDECKKNGIKPLLGSEVYVARRSLHDKSEKVDRSGYHLVLLAKNMQGYKNLVKLVSIGHVDGFYYRPRIDHKLLQEYSEGLIALSACLGGEISQKVMRGTETEQDDAVLWFKDVFRDDFYLEVQRHETNREGGDTEIFTLQQKVNSRMLELSEKHGVEVVATNDVHFAEEDDADAHDLLLCLSTGKDLDDPTRMRYSKQEWLKTSEEMETIFSDIPQAVSRTAEIVAKIEEYNINRDPIMPDFPLPENFSDAKSYLKHLTTEGAKKRYGENFSQEVQERIDMELNTVASMGFSSYFLIVQDVINEAKKMGVIVGPGRGSAAGSVIAYCTGITNVDPISHNLLFERFLNKSRISMPDIDIDFDDDGREKVLKWVATKYGSEKVAHIVTFGSMAAKMSIRDVARVLKLPLYDANRIAKLIPTTPGITLEKAFKEVPELREILEKGTALEKKVLDFAQKLEGCIRQTGVHACGILIGKKALMEHLPVMNTKDSNLLSTQYDGKLVEDVGMLKMDFLGLKTLSIINDCLKNIKITHNIDIDIEQISINDEKTFQLFANGETSAIFQFESDGMKKHLRALKPNRFEDLIAMNALYRPGPMQYIPDYIHRKHGQQKVEYDHPMMEEYLQETYGITVFQEQVMLLSRKLGGLSPTESDSLRKAMGKKKKEEMLKFKEKFAEGCLANEEFIKGIPSDKKPEEIIQKIWTDWEAFAQYAFNKSHSVCYADIAYRTAYLKAHYPSDFMSAVLGNNLSDITKIRHLMDECNRMRMNILGPSVNESQESFVANKEGNLRYGLVAIKGVGLAAAQHILEVRNTGGIYKNIFDFVERLNLSTVNKKSLESLILAGALDEFNLPRSQYFSLSGGEQTFLEELLQYGANYSRTQKGLANSLFGGDSTFQEAIKKPEIKEVEEWHEIDKLEKEKECIGIYLSSHPLDKFRFELERFTSQVSLTDLSQNMEQYHGKELTLGGLVVDGGEYLTKGGKAFSKLRLMNHTGELEFAFFSKDHVAFGNFCKRNICVIIKGKVQNRWNRENDFEFKVQAIDLMDNLRETKVQSITLQIPLSELNKEKIDGLYETVENNKGSVLLKVKIYEEEKNISLALFSRTYKVSLSNSFLQNVQDELGIPIKIN